MSAQEFDRAAFAAELERLAQICSSLNMNVEAATTRQWLVPQRGLWDVLYLPSEPLVAVEPSHPHWADWARRFQAARTRYAQTLFAEAQRQAAAGDEATAFRLLWHVLREDASHADAKRILGTLAKAATVTPRLRKGTTPHPDFGWPAGSYSRIDTPHFSLTTRAETGPSSQLAQIMERYYALWRQVFYPLWSTPGSLSKKFEGRNTPWERSDQMSVVLLRDREDYLQVLGVAEQNAAVSVGYYSPHQKSSFFYAADNYEITLFHELTHQLFAEGTNFDARPEAGSLGGVWLTEGIALYMESLVERGSYWTVGGLDAPRLQTARYRAIRDGYWAEWPAFTQGHVEAWKQAPDIALLYTQATGLTHLFMDRLPQPDSREALLQALVSVYHNQPDFNALLPLLKSDEANAKTAYQLALQLNDDDVQSLCQAGLACESLVLAGSELAPASWRDLKALAPTLRWLDMSFTNATAGELLWLAEAVQLERLSVEGTICDGKLVKTIAQLPRLQELDLSGCPLDDAALAALAGHDQLETLWLTGTQVSDQALPTLARLPKLKFCHIERTGITVEAWERFKSQHPHLTN